RRARRAADLRMRRRPDGLALAEQLLVQLLPRARADERDRHLATRLLARERDHVPREVDDPHRLAHVEHEDLAAPADRARLDDELRGLRDRHEEARHLRMRHRHRPALLDLGRKIVITLPAEPRTLPKLTETKR